MTTPHPSEAPQVPKAPEAPKAPKARKTPEAPRAPRAPKTSKTPKTTKVLPQEAEEIPTDPLPCGKDQRLSNALREALEIAENVVKTWEPCLRAVCGPRVAKRHWALQRTIYMKAHVIEPIKVALKELHKQFGSK